MNNNNTIIIQEINSLKSQISILMNEVNTLKYKLNNNIEFLDHQVHLDYLDQEEIRVIKEIKVI